MKNNLIKSGDKIMKFAQQITVNCHPMCLFNISSGIFKTFISIFLVVVNTVFKGRYFNSDSMGEFISSILI